MKKRDFLKTLPLWITPVVTSVTLPAHAQTSPAPEPRSGGDDPECLPDEDCYVNPTCDDPICTEEWTKSSFAWDGNSLCNVGDGPSLCPIAYVVIRFITVNQGGGPFESVQESGFIEPLGEAGCYDFSSLMRKYWVAAQYDRICIRVYQDDGHPGVGYTQNCY